MVSKKSRTAVRENKHRRMRHHLAGTAQRPRLAVFRSNNHMYAQIIDDTVGNTLVSERGGFIYQGKVKALADAAREAGLDF